MGMGIGLAVGKSKAKEYIAEQCNDMTSDLYKVDVLYATADGVLCSA